MTIILTEVSHLGIAMVADSLITKLGAGQKRYAHWKKLLKVRQKQPTLGSRIGYLKSVLEIAIQIYKVKSMSTIGGEVLTIGIRPDGSYDPSSSATA